MKMTKENQSVNANKNAGKLEFLKLAAAKFGEDGSFNRTEFLALVESVGSKFVKKDWRWLLDSVYRQGRGEYKLPASYERGRSIVKSPKMVVKPAKGKTLNHSALTQVKLPIADQSTTVDMAVVNFPTAPAPKVAAQAFDPNATSEYDVALVPQRDPLYVPFGDFKDVEVILASKNFFPLFVVGMSGNGKTFMIEQAASRTGRPLIRIQMSRETDEDDLIGGFRLVNGETKFIKGPAIRAMEQGAVLLIDEADRSDPGKVMCLQGILEGKPYYIKKTGELIVPVEGFTVVATANTKGRGSDDGRYVAAGILDDAWLERFPITIEQMFPSSAIETRILNGYLCAGRDCTDEDRAFVTHLIAWSSIIRKTFDEQAIDEVISTRRLVHIVNTYLMFGDRMRAIKLCINRFDTETKNTFLELYTKVDPTMVPPTPAPMPSPDGMSPQSADLNTSF